MRPPAVVVEGLSVTLGDTWVLRNLSIECREGEFLAVVGRSGVGKTTLLNAFAGFVPYAGRIVRPGAVGYVFQDHALFPWMTAEQNIAFGLTELSVPERRQRTEEMFDRIGLSDVAKKYPHELSGGQTQRVALARTLAPDPRLILMDEPYTALDHHTRESMQTWLLSIWGQSRKTIVFVTHDVEEAIFLADRVCVLVEGRIAAAISIPFKRPREPLLRFDERFLTIKRELISHLLDAPFRNYQQVNGS